MNDRRQTGVNQVVLADGNGQTMKLVTATARTGQLVLGVVIALGTVIGGVYVAVKTGVNVEIEDAVEEMAADEHSGLHREMVEVAEREAEEMMGVLQDDLDIFELEQKAQGETIIRMEERQINLRQKMDDDKEDIIEEIRRDRGGGG